VTSVGRPRSESTPAAATQVMMMIRLMSLQYLTRVTSYSTVRHSSLSQYALLYYLVFMYYINLPLQSHSAYSESGSGVGPGNQRPLATTSGKPKPFP